MNIPVQQPGHASGLAVALALLLAFSGVTPPSVAHAQENQADELDFEIPEAEAPSAFSLWGKVEQRSIARFTDQDALLYKQRFYQETDKSSLSDFLLRLKPEMSYKNGELGLYARPRLDLTWSTDKPGGAEPDEPSELLFMDEAHWGGVALIEEGFASWQPSHALTLEAGKKVLKWGKGYAWNPVAFASRPKDVDNPEETREGYVLAYADYIKSFDGALTTLALTPVVVPVGEQVNADLASSDTLLYGGKAYLLLFDTDIDLLFMDGKEFGTRLGLDFATNITSNLALHGELALVQDYDKPVTDEQGNLRTQRSDALSYLIGLRYLNAYDTTFIFEYYHNGEGYTPSEMKTYFSLIADGYEQFLETGGDQLLRRSKSAGKTYNRSSAGRDYLYAKISQKEPFDVLYLTPSLAIIANIGDGSLSVNPEVSYLVLSDLELKARLAVPFGPANSEFGEKLQDAKTELWLTYYF